MDKFALFAATICVSMSVVPTANAQHRHGGHVHIAHSHRHAGHVHVHGGAYIGHSHYINAHNGHYHYGSAHTTAYGYASPPIYVNLQSVSAATPPTKPSAASAPDPATIQVTLSNPDAIVTLDGAKTTSTGLVRSFLTPVLEPGYQYSCKVQVLWTQNGETLADVRTVHVVAGQTVAVDFTRPAAEQVALPASKQKLTP